MCAVVCVWFLLGFCVCLLACFYVSLFLSHVHVLCVVVFLCLSVCFARSSSLVFSLFLVLCGLLLLLLLLMLLLRLIFLSWWWGPVCAESVGVDVVNAVVSANVVVVVLVVAVVVMVLVLLIVITCRSSLQLISC